MTAYLLLLILAVGIPFLLYCLWNFTRELRPHRSGAVLSIPSMRKDVFHNIPMSQLRSRPQVVSLRNQNHVAS
jgi:hypothetical protein